MGRMIPPAEHFRSTIPVVAKFQTLIRDLLLVLRAVPGVEIGRLRRGPDPLLAMLRARGRRGFARTHSERARLAQIIRVADACFPGGGNCYRRALLEIAVDPVAATTPLRLGLRTGGGPRSGHAWLGANTDDPGAHFDAEFSV
jgi:hypothetical protein